MTGPIRLDPLEQRHAELLLAAAHESVNDVYPWLPWCRADLTLDEVHVWIREQRAARRDGSAYEFALLHADGGYLGGGGVNAVDATRQCANVGYWIRTAMAGRGFGTAALVELVQWTFRCTPLQRVEVVVATGNRGSQRVAEKAGAVKQGISRARLLIHNRHHDAVIYTFNRGIEAFTQRPQPIRRSQKERQ